MKTLPKITEYCESEVDDALLKSTFSHLSDRDLLLGLKPSTDVFDWYKRAISLEVQNVFDFTKYMYFESDPYFNFVLKLEECKRLYRELFELYKTNAFKETGLLHGVWDHRIWLEYLFDNPLLNMDETQYPKDYNECKQTIDTLNELFLQEYKGKIKFFTKQLQGDKKI